MNSPELQDLLAWHEYDWAEGTWRSLKPLSWAGEGAER